VAEDTTTAGISEQYARELAVAARLAREAGEIAMGYRAGGELLVEMKPGDEPVTAADRAASDLIVAGLSETFTDDIIISEENADDLRRLDASRVWYIDPIDGTKDFIKGRDGFCVMIGMTHDYWPVVGVLYQPISKQLFAAAHGAGAWLIDGEGDDAQRRQIHCSKVADVGDIRLVASANNRTSKIDEVKSALGIDTEFNIGSVGLKLALIALGERELYVNPSSKCKVWDTCAPEVVLNEAGGKITNLYGEALPYDTENIARNTGLLATNDLVHDAVVNKMAPLFPRG